MEERKDPAVRNREVLTNIDTEVQNTSFDSEKHLDLLHPLRPLTGEEIENLRLRFRELGFKVDNLTEEEKDSLKESQFRRKPGDYLFLGKKKKSGHGGHNGSEKS